MVTPALETHGLKAVDALHVACAESAGVDHFLTRDDRLLKKQKHSAVSSIKATRFRASWQVGEGDYLVIREQLFAKETVKSLYKKIEEFQKKKSRK